MMGMLLPLLALLLERDGIDTTWIGLNAAIGSLAVVILGPFIPRILEAVGVMRAMYGAIIAAVIIILLFPIWHGLNPWFVLRFFLGVCLAFHWVISEVWIVTLSTAKNRGLVIALYMTMLAAGFGAGPLLINVIGIDGWLPFLLSAGLVGLSAVPLLLIRGRVPDIPPPAPASFITAFRVAPLILAAAVLAGFTDTAQLSLLPIYGLRNGFDQDTAVLMLSVLVAGNIVLQMPLGWLSDRMDRRRLLILLSAILVVAPLVLPFVLHEGFLLWPLLVLWGGASVGIYTVALALLGDRFHATALASANAAFVAVFETGSIAGPVAVGVGMDVLGAQGFEVVLMAAGMGFLILSGVRRLLSR